MSVNKKPFIIVALLLVVALIGFKLYSVSKFHVVRTDPDMSSVSTDTPYIKIYWNDQLDASSLSLNDASGTVDHVSVDGKTMKIFLRNNLKVGNPYTIIVASLKSNAGKIATNKQFTFTAKRLADVKQSDEQRNAMVAQQDKPVYEVQRLNYINFTKLYEAGITSAQLNSVKQGLFDYSNIVNKKFWTMTLKPDSLSITPYNPDTTTQGVDFTVTLSGQDYRAHAAYKQTVDDVHLILTDSNGASVFDSANTIN